MNKKIILFALSASLVAACVASESRESFMPTIKEKIQCPAKTSEKNFITVEHNRQKGLWEQLSTQRPPEHDTQQSTPIPFSDGKQFQTNVTQIINLLSGIVCIGGGAVLLEHTPTKYAIVGFNNKKIPEYTGWGLYAIGIRRLYNYAMGQKIPFRIIDSQKSSTTKKETTMYTEGTESV